MDPSNFLPRRRPEIIPDPKHCPPGPFPASYVRFCRPGDNTSFLQLPAHDPCPGPVRFGLHHETALTACRILAFNKPGFLSTSNRRKDKNARVIEGPDFVLSSREYYYHLRKRPLKKSWSVCHEFRKWPFPHDALPPSWGGVLRGPPFSGSSSTLDQAGSLENITKAVIHRDRSCVLTGSADSLVAARVVPENAKRWFIKNNMIRYTNISTVQASGGRHDLDLDLDPGNTFALRADLDKPQFQQGYFVIAPKGGRLVVHFLTPTTECPRYYHNVAFDHHATVSHPLLYARFAWAVIRASRKWIGESEPETMEPGCLDWISL